jgi:hypothetical protein
MDCADDTFACGLECVEDLISDLQQGFEALREQARLARAA